MDAPKLSKKEFWG